MRPTKARHRTRRAKLASLLLMTCSLFAQQGLAQADTADTAETQALPWQDQQSDSAVVRGRFRQEKHLAELDQPLVSTGRFTVARGHGLIWQVEQPLSTQLVITREQLVERSDGHETARISAREQPGLAVVAAVLLAVFQGDMERLRQFFVIERDPTDAPDAVVTLRPASAAVSEFVQRIRIEGGTRIERLRIEQPGGDYSVIDLETNAGDSDASTGELTADEQAAFSH